MANKYQNAVLREKNLLQAIVILDTFNDEFLPISDSTHLALLPLLNKPLVEYNLEFLSIAGFDEVYLFCCSHYQAIKNHINKRINEENAEWSVLMKVNVIFSESCNSFGDCLRDMDAKGLIRDNFVLFEPGAVANIRLLPILKKHTETLKKDKGAAVTLIYQETEPKNAKFIVAANDSNRILYHKKFTNEREFNVPLEIFLENARISMHHNLQDTNICVCSAAVLPIFSDNFDFQTKDDLIRGLLMNEEILGNTIYCDILNAGSYSGVISSWRSFQKTSDELRKNWLYPLQPIKKYPTFSNSFIDESVTIPSDSIIENSVIACGVVFGSKVIVRNCIIFANAKIQNDSVLKYSLIGENVTVEAKSEIIGCVVGDSVQIESGSALNKSLIQNNKPDNCGNEDILGKKAFRLHKNFEGDESVDEVRPEISPLRTDEDVEEVSEEDSADSDSENEELSDTQSPLPDDTKLFYTEVIDSLTRGFEDELQCDNLILEINSSRYAYNVTLKEVNFNVVKSILTISLRFPTGPQYFGQFSRLLSFFSPILKNYIRNESAMFDTLQAIEDVANSNENIAEKWTTFLLNWLYNKDHIAEEPILSWAETLDKESKFYSQVKPFTEWLEEAEEDSD